MGKNQQYANQYAVYAMEQMRKYGIPASVTLAQGILESSNGQSALARSENNHFGIKATPAWIAQGGAYGIYTDDKPNEKFCRYDSVRDSYEHHSKFLKENSRYAACFALAADDYKGWSQGLEKAGYATGGNYAATLQRIIEQNGLQGYDQTVMQQMQAEGREFGADAETLGTAAAESESKYSFPVEREEFLFITSPFGMRQDPTDADKQQMHKGVDIRCKGDAVLATEKGGKVVAVNRNAATTGGKSVTVEYGRADGSKVLCTYMHLSDICVGVGDTAHAGERLGISGSTGTRTTGEHLHFGVVNIYADGTRHDIDPAAYLADIARKGNIKVQALYNGADLLAKYKGAEVAATGKPLTPDDWMKKLLSSEDSGVGISGCSDSIVDMAMTAFASLMLLAVQIDNRREEEQMAAISAAVDRQRIDLAALMPGMKSCALVLGENGKAVLHADNGTVQVSRELTSAELNRLSVSLGSGTLTEESKRMRVAGMVNAIVLSEVASQNFEQEMNRQQGQTENLRR